MNKFSSLTPAKVRSSTQIADSKVALSVAALLSACSWPEHDSHWEHVPLAGPGQNFIPPNDWICFTSVREAYAEFFSEYGIRVVEWYIDEHWCTDIGAEDLLENIVVDGTPAGSTNYNTFIEITNPGNDWIYIDETWCGWAVYFDGTLKKIATPYEYSAENIDINGWDLVYSAAMLGTKSRQFDETYKDYIPLAWTLNNVFNDTNTKVESVLGNLQNYAVNWQCYASSEAREFLAEQVPEWHFIILPWVNWYYNVQVSKWAIYDDIWAHKRFSYAVDNQPFVLYIEANVAQHGNENYLGRTPDLASFPLRSWQTLHVQFEWESDIISVLVP